MKGEVRSQRKIGIFLSYAILILDAILGIVYTPLLLNGLGESEYGLYQLVGSLINYFAIMDLGLGSTITRYFLKFKSEQRTRERDNFFAMALVVYSIISLIILFGGGLLALYFGRIFTSLPIAEVVEGRILVCFLAVNLVITLFDHAFSGVLNSFEQFAFDKGLRLSRVIVKAILIIVLLQFFPSAILIVVVDFVLTLSILLAKVVVCKRNLEVVPRLVKWDTPLMKEVFVFTFAIFLQAIINQFNNNVDKTVLGIFSTTAVVAVYSIAMQLYSAFSGISTSIQTVYFPKISNIVFSGASSHEITLSLVQPSRYQFIMLSMVCIAFWLFGYEFIYLWCGKTDAWIITCMVMTAGIIELSQNTTTSVLKAKNLLVGKTLINLFTAVGNFIITLLLVPKYGMIGAASGTVFSLIIGYVIINNIYYKCVVKIDIILFFKKTYKGFLFPIVLSLLVGLLLNVLIPNYSWGGFVIKSTLFVVFYLSFLYLFTFNSLEKKLIISFIKKLSLRLAKK